jgi:hypothetical protein
LKTSRKQLIQTAYKIEEALKAFEKVPEASVKVLNAYVHAALYMLGVGTLIYLLIRVWLR